jgi:hypothetical protein
MATKSKQPLVFGWPLEPVTISIELPKTVASLDYDFNPPKPQRLKTKLSLKLQGNKIIAITGDGEETSLITRIGPRTGIGNIYNLPSTAFPGYAYDYEGDINWNNVAHFLSFQLGRFVYDNTRINVIWINNLDDDIGQQDIYNKIEHNPNIDEPTDNNSRSENSDEAETVRKAVSTALFYTPRVPEENEAGVILLRRWFLDYENLDWYKFDYGVFEELLHYHLDPAIVLVLTQIVNAINTFLDRAALNNPCEFTETAIKLWAKHYAVFNKICVYPTNAIISNIL